MSNRGAPYERLWKQALEPFCYVQRAAGSLGVDLAALRAGRGYLYEVKSTSGTFRLSKSSFLREQVASIATAQAKSGCPAFYAIYDKAAHLWEVREVRFEIVHGIGPVCMLGEPETMADHFRRMFGHPISTQRTEEKSVSPPVAPLPTPNAGGGPSAEAV